MTIDREKYIDTGLITERAHPTEPYLIYNYTPKCQFSRAWDEVTMQCRGLILHKDTGEVIARPFPKFFNYEEYVQNGGVIPDEVPNVYDKRDGSLGILYWGTDGKPAIATRGSFTSDQALWATDFLRKNYGGVGLQNNTTFLFEIIYPENRIVVDYRGRKGLDLIAMIDTETGSDCSYRNFELCGRLLCGLGIPVRAERFISYGQLKALNSRNAEGFVLHYPKNGLRLKIKFEDYVRLHKVMTGLSEIGIWEMLKEGKTLEEIIGETPDEMHEWIKEVVVDLSQRFSEIEEDAADALAGTDEQLSRKENAEILKKSKYAGIAFAMFDKKEYAKMIWRMVRPHGSRTFRKDIDL